ncbi:hypothetical protein DV451_001409 [Geotrichum candidum]|uniref:Zinc finger CCCH domain-containing protein 15 n=1 Tax=Geotrichum candidum TaxID=1173061 RepID=A0A9P5KUG7_GEOCN|nr:hypothetical protein DV451_001409 [Geotrichum candidum]
MPPKKNQESQKNKANKRTQKAEDKTFGLKNKNKSKKVQNFVKQVEAQTANSNANKRAEVEKARRAAEKKAAEDAKRDALINPIIQQQKVPFGVDPKTVLCAFFKAGQCTKGNKCKFSHDLEIGRKVSKKDLYTDDRAKEKEQDTMDKWDEEKLRQVITSKHGNPITMTDIVCKYFIEAVENGKYGWFWECPNGGKACKYRHSLPSGFVLKTKEQRAAEKLAAANQPVYTLEEFLETERFKLGKNLTPITLESFTEWKKKRDAKKKQDEDDKNKKTKVLSGKQLLLSGKFVEEEDEEEDASDAWDMEDLKRRVEESSSENTTESFGGRDDQAETETVEA